MSSDLRGHLYGLMNEEQQDQARKAALDSAIETSGDSAEKYELMTARMDSAAAINQWIEDGDSLEEGEQLSDRLMSLMVGIANDDKNGELDDDEHEIMASALESAWDYLSSIGAADEDLDLLLNDWDAEAAVRVHELVTAGVEGDGDDELDSFVFGEEAQKAIFDATYKKKVAVRGGKKVRIKKRVSGKVRLSGKQKVAIRKAQRKSRSSGAKMRRKKSMKKRQKMGL